MEKIIKIEENNFEGLLESPEQNHIKKKLCYLLAKNNLIFNWSAKEKKTNKK